MHIMVDLETLDTKPIAVIRQIGYCIFDPFGTDVISSQLVHVDISDQVEMGRSISPETFCWWLKQDEASRTAMADFSNDISPRYALKQFSAEFIQGEPTFVWGHGATFDPILLENLYTMVDDDDVPWKYNAVRDTRTLFALIPNFEMVKNTEKHNAKADAIAQALSVQKAYRELGIKK